MNYKIHYFTTSNGEREYILISDRPTEEIAEEYKDDDLRIEQSIDIDGSAMSMPCDRLLAEA